MYVAKWLLLLLLFIILFALCRFLQLSCLLVDLWVRPSLNCSSPGSFCCGLVVVVVVVVVFVVEHIFVLYVDFGSSPVSLSMTERCLLVACLTSQQHASVSQGRICADNLTCCHTEIEVADQTFYLTQSQYTVTGPTSPSADPISPGAWQGSHWSTNFYDTGMTRPRKNPSASGIRTRDLPPSRRTP